MVLYLCSKAAESGGETQPLTLTVLDTLPEGAALYVLLVSVEQVNWARLVKHSQELRGKSQ